MYRYHVTITLGAEASAGILEQGFADRKESLRQRFEAEGVTLESYWLTDEGDTIMVLSSSEPVNMAMRSTTSKAAGIWLNKPQVTQIYDVDEMDAAIAADGFTSTLPGS